MNEIYEKMREHLERNDQSNVRGLSSREVVAQTYTDSDFEKIVTKLKERPIDSEVLFRLSSFVWEGQQNRIPEYLRQRAADAIADCIPDSDAKIIAEVVLIFVFWGNRRADYRDTCIKLLSHPYEEVRETALKCSSIFLRRSEYSKLFEFRRDPSFSETMGMGGPLRFTVRDEALRTLESLTNAPKSDGDCFENTSEGKVSYRSWSPFLNWFEQNKAKFRD
ncbi:MAG: hypothetical protein HY298_05885 [Verrucomicrobia bacterium]|nr:hypothetical protein [Verrucomicrobiota bacterium]